MRDVSRFEDLMLRKCHRILEKEEITSTEAKIIEDTIRLLEFTHGSSMYFKDREELVAVHGDKDENWIEEE